MKTKVTFNAVALSLKEETGKDGGKFYRMSIDQDGEAGTLPMTEESYKGIVGIFQKYKPVTINAEYNDQYKSMRIISCSQGLK